MLKAVAILEVGGGTGVTSLNGETGDITLVQGTNITITSLGQNISISSTGGGGGSPGGSQYNVQINNGTGGFFGDGGFIYQSGNVSIGGADLTAALNLNGDSPYGQIAFHNSPNTGNYGGIGIEGADGQIILGSAKGDLSYWSSGGNLNFSANAGSSIQMSINGTTGQINIPQLTASELTATDASSNLQSLPTATYPSLVEISYVKGVVSDIQAQLDAKQIKFVWNEVIVSTQALVPSNGYVMNNASQVVGTLPASALFGAEIRIVGKGAGGWKIAQNSGQTIHFGNQNTTTGATGSIASQNVFDCLDLLCITADTDWVAHSSQGNLTVT